MDKALNRPDSSLFCCDTSSRQGRSIFLFRFVSLPLSKMGPRSRHVWLTSYPGSRGFSCLFVALVLLCHAEKNQEKPLRPEYLQVNFLHTIGILYIFLCVDSVTKNWFAYTISRCLNFKENCWGSLTNCRGVTCDGLASRPGGVEILQAASCYRNGVSSGCYEPVGSKASLFR